MNLSVILPVLVDDGVAECLASIDADVEVVVVLNGGAAGVDRRLFDHAQVRIVETPRPGLAHACQLGVAAATNDLVLFMNSDCVFMPGSLARMYAAHREGGVVVGRVRYSHSTAASRLVDRLNQVQRTKPQHAFQPNLLLDRRLAFRLEGYIFDARLDWTEDADLHRRIVAAGIPIRSEPASCVEHRPQTLRGFLRCADKYGKGRAQAQHLRLTNATPIALTPGLLIRDAWHNLRHGGPVTALYGLVWMVRFVRATQRPPAEPDAATPRRRQA